MKVRRKSRWRSQNNKLARKRANQRSAKARLRLARALAVPELPDTRDIKPPRRKLSGFRVTIHCYDDRRSASFQTLRMPWGGLSISPTRAGRKVACLLAHYQPQPHIR